MALIQEQFVLEHNYPVYIAVWLLISVFIIWFFRFMYNKMRDTDDRQTKSSLFTITMFFGIPLLLVSVLGPLFFLIGDKNMPPVYMYTWIALIAVFIIYFVYKQRSKSN